MQSVLIGRQIKFSIYSCSCYFSRFCNMAVGGRDELLSYLKELDIGNDIISHPEVFTVEAMMPYLKDIDGHVCKNLFLKDKKKKLWLLTALATQEVNLGKLSKIVSAPGLRFADESIMIEKLGVSQGCCTPLALFNDKAGDVKFVLDSQLLSDPSKRIYSHPMVNTETMGMTATDFKKFVTATGHEAVIIDFEAN